MLDALASLLSFSACYWKLSKHLSVKEFLLQQEENNMLKIQNEDLTAKLRRTETNLSRVKEELAQYRASIGKNPYINFDMEERLNNKLKVSAMS